MQMQDAFCVPVKPQERLDLLCMPFYNFPIETQLLMARELKTMGCSAYKRLANQVLPYGSVFSQARNSDSLLQLPLLLTGLTDFLVCFSSFTSISRSYYIFIVCLLLSMGQARYEAIVSWCHPGRTHQLSPSQQPEESFVYMLKSPFLYHSTIRLISDSPFLSAR